MGDSDLFGLLGLRTRGREASRIDKDLVGSFKSPFARERERMRRRLVRFSTENPLDAVGVLLKHYYHPDERVRENVRSTLEEIISSTGKEALLDNL
ncbi:MAG: hypothetical protein ACLFPN_06395, partial [Methanomassiliicoccales archaeon]